MPSELSPRIAALLDESTWRRPERAYEGSALERHHQAARTERGARDAASARLAAEHRPNLRAVHAATIEMQKAATVRFHAAKRRTLTLRRTPAWADMAEIRAVYSEAQALTRATGIEHHVDHFYPLQGQLVSGLHVHQNLQILTASENSRKGNRFEVEG